MGFGYLESVYEKCLIIELEKANFSVESQSPIKVFYEGENVGDFIADIIVNDIVIVELKSVRRIAKVHEVQLVNYLTATGKDVGLVINFGPEHVEIKRKAKTFLKWVFRRICGSGCTPVPLIMPRRFTCTCTSRCTSTVFAVLTCHLSSRFRSHATSMHAISARQLLPSVASRVHLTCRTARTSSVAADCSSAVRA